VRVVRFALLLAALGCAVAVAAVPACSSSPAPAPVRTLTHDQLLDPQSCNECHGDHYREWSGSMHAYAGVDPLFLAMNKRAQRETNGKNADFCVRCHTPMAVRTGATKDGLNLDGVDPKLKGVTCYFCHSVASVDGENDDPLTLATDDVMRGEIADPVHTAAHGAGYSAIHDRNRPEAAGLCGSCHDVTLGSGVVIEQTYVEWKGGLFAHDDPKTLLTCSSCHMPGSDGLAANLPNVPTRRVFDHSMPGVDVALTDFPEKDAQRAGVQSNLDPSLVAKLCVRPPTQGDTLAVTLDAAFVGHAWPSGAVHDRRAWVEVIAKTAGSVVYQSGVVADGTSIETITNDPNLWVLKEQLFDASSKGVLMMWQAVTTQSDLLSVAVTSDPNDPRYYHSTTKTYPVPPSADDITVRVRMIPVVLEVVDDLIASGDLDPQYRTQLPVFTLAGTQLHWTSANGFACVP
jgi:hypothetical protein